MRLSTQILTGIVGITVLTQVIFAMIAYWIVVDVEQDHLLELLQHRTDEVAQSVAIPLATGTPIQQSLEQSRRHFAPSVEVLALLDSQGLLTTTGPWAKRIDATLLGNKIRDADSHAMQRITIANGSFLVVSRPVPGLQYHIVSLQHYQAAQDNLTGRLGNRFFVFSIMIIWSAVWISLLLAAVINRKLEEKNSALRHQVTHDTLTGLPNRALLYQQLEKLIASPDDIDMQLAVLAIGIDNFMEINDTLGHDLGDQLLLETGGRIRQILPEDALISRMGGNEFAVVLTNTDQDAAEQCTRLLLSSMDTRITVNRIELDIGLTIGVALYPKHATEADALLRYADVALQQTREHCAGFMFYDGERDHHSVRRLKLGAELANAIKRGELVVFYQPKISVASGTVTGLEALVRWNHPEYGLIPPDEFIPLAEQTGAIHELTKWVLEESLHFLHRLHVHGITIDIAVNISTHNLRDNQLRTHVDELLRRTGIASRHLCLEVTETVMMQDINHAEEVLCSLHAIGVKVSIDDFGTGFSSLAYLNRLPVDEIKVDRSFVMPMLEHYGEQAIVMSIIKLAHTLGCSVVAEGVENHATLELLKSMDCDVAQGYLLTAPLPMNKIESWLDTYQPISIQHALPQLSDATDTAC